MRELTAAEKTAFLRLLGTIRKMRVRNILRTRYADSEQRAALMGIAIPPSMEGFAAVLGWPQKTCDVMSRQLVPNGFTGISADAVSTLNTVFESNRVRLIEQNLIQSAVKHGVSFAFVSRGRSGEPDPLITVRSALEATAELDPRTGRVKFALEVISRDEMLFYTPGTALTLKRSARAWMVEVELKTAAEEAVLCTPYVHGVSLDRPFGKSRITRPVMHLTDIAVRILLRQEVGAEFFNAPQRYMLGAKMDMFKDEQGNPIPAWEALIGSAVVVPDLDPNDPAYNDMDAKLNRVEVGQFAQMSMQPNSDHMKTVAMMFAGESDIPVNQLGLILDNPPSADSIVVMDAALASAARSERIGMGVSREDLARNVLMALEGEAGERAAVGVNARWLKTESERQGAQQDMTAQVTAGILPPDSVVVLERLGYSDTEIVRIQADQRRARGVQLATALAQVTATRQQPQQVEGAPQQAAITTGTPANGGTT